MKDLINLLTDKENQPHQFIGDPEELEKKIMGLGILSFSVRQAENGYELQVHEPVFRSWIFRSPEELVDHIASNLLHLSH